MATEYLFSNNATTTLAQSVSATATVLNVASGEGSLFPSPASGQAFAVTLVDAATGLTNEICYCTSRSGDQLTVTRGQEGTNATSWSAGDTCANYITARVMASWLQASSLNGYATEAWSNNRFVVNNGTNGGITMATMDAASGQPALLDGDGTWHVLQPYGSYATTVQLNAEINNRSSADNNLQTQVNNRVIKTGDTMTGTLNIAGGSGLYVTLDPGGQTSGSYTNYGQLVSQAGGRGGSFGFYVQEHVGVSFNGVIVLTQSDGTTRFLGVPGPSSRINDSHFGDFAYTSDLENYQPKGDYVPSSEISYGTVTGGTYTKVGTILRQSFIVQNVVHDNTGTWVSFPISYSNTNNITVQTTNNSNNDMDTFAYGWTTTGCYLNIPYNSASSGNPVSVTVEGYAG